MIWLSRRPGPGLLFRGLGMDQMEWETAAERREGTDRASDILTIPF